MRIPRIRTPFTNRSMESWRFRYVIVCIHNLFNDEKSYLKILDWHSSISTLITCLITKKIVKRRYEKIPI